MEIEENTTLNKSTSQVKYGSAKTKKTLFVKIGIAAGILIIIASAIYILVDSGALKGAFDNISAIFKEKPENLNALKDSTEADSLKRKALLYEEALADSIEQANTAYQGKIAYFIVAGSFKSAQNAQKQINSLMGKGYKAEMINLGDTLYRVSIGTYYDRRKAVEEYIAITNQDPELKIWMFSRLR